MVRSIAVRRAFLLLVGLISLGLAACGGGGGGGSDDAQKLVRETFASSKPLRSGKLQVTAAIDAHGIAALGGPIKLSFAGPFDRGAKGDVPKFDFTVSVGLAGKTYSAGAASTGTQGFLSLQKDSYALPAAQYASLKKSFTQLQGVAQPKTKGGKLDWLTDPKVVGDSDVQGDPTTHVTGTVDVGKLLQEVEASQASGTKLSADQVARADKAIKHPTFDFYTGKDDHVLRRVTVGFTVAIPSSQRAQLGGLSSADVNLDYQVADLNKPQTITAPANPKPIAQLAPKLQALQQILSALATGNTGSSGSSGGTTTSPGTGSSGSSGSGSSGVSKQAQAYSQCIQAAGNDVAKQQKCADLLK